MELIYQKFLTKNLINVLFIIILPQFVLAQNVATKKPSSVPDYTHLYPTSTPEEFERAAEQTRLGCNEYRRKSIKIAPKSNSQRGEDPLLTCKCLIRNLSSAQDIHEMRVLNAMFRDQQPPNSLFEKIEGIGDVFDERQDYRDHAIRTIENCASDPKFTSQ